MATKEVLRMHFKERNAFKITHPNGEVVYWSKYKGYTMKDFDESILRAYGFTNTHIKYLKEEIERVGSRYSIVRHSIYMHEDDGFIFGIQVNASHLPYSEPRHLAIVKNKLKVLTARERITEVLEDCANDMTVQDVAYTAGVSEITVKRYKDRGMLNIENGIVKKKSN